jgi:hypothetical protein
MSTPLPNVTAAKRLIRRGRRRELGGDSEHDGAKQEDPISDGEENSGEEKVFVGIVAESKTLYAKLDKDNNRSWSHSPPDGLETAAESGKTLKYAVLVRKMKPKSGDSTQSLVIDSIVIQSPYLKRVLGKVFKGYPGIVTDVSRLVISAPFWCFVHRWEDFLDAKDDESHDQDTKTHMEVLYDIMDAELRDTIQEREDAIRSRAISWDHVWTLFPPRTAVLTSMRDKLMAVEFESGEYMETKRCGWVFKMKCHAIDWDGKKTGWAVEEVQIQKYAGKTSFEDLECRPLKHAVNADQIRAYLIARGKKFQSLADNPYQYYDGIAAYHPETAPNKTLLEPVSGRIFLDAASWNRINPINAVFLRSLDQENPRDDEISDLRRRYAAMSSMVRGRGMDLDTEDMLKATNDPIRGDLSEEELLFASPLVRGYSLANRKWMKFFVDGVSDISFDTNAFDSLVVEDQQKKLILSFARSHVNQYASFDDVISGKGRGIIIMLSGGPGIGKTLTAESVAEEMRVPLYIMSAGDLGTKSHEVEQRLESILSIVSKWKAVLLLDECDIFLERRTPHDLERNQIVGVFLRMLEYYQGILFMTTNRVQNIDPAFNSRIHLSLHYPDLDMAARAKIWKTFLGKITSYKGETINCAITDEEIDRLSKLNINGRQIKNAIKMASLLLMQAETIQFEHVHSVLKIQGYSL